MSEVGEEDWSKKVKISLAVIRTFLRTNTQVGIQEYDHSELNSVLGNIS